MKKKGFLIPVASKKISTFVHNLLEIRRIFIVTHTIVLVFRNLI